MGKWQPWASQVWRALASTSHLRKVIMCMGLQMFLALSQWSLPGALLPPGGHLVVTPGVGVGLVLVCLVCGGPMLPRIGFHHRTKSDSKHDACLRSPSSLKRTPWCGGLHVFPPPLLGFHYFRKQRARCREQEPQAQTCEGKNIFNLWCLGYCY